MVLGVVGTIWSLRNLILKFFSSKMTLTGVPPLLTYLRDISADLDEKSTFCSSIGQISSLCNVLKNAFVG